MKYFSLIAPLMLAVQLQAQKDFDIEGHRGCRGLYPENTIVAFIEAVKLGVNTLELDVVVSKDGQLVVSHDPFLNPSICNGPDGSPVTEDNKKDFALYHMDYAEIEKCDCGSRGNPKFPEQHKLAVHKPLLREVIDSVENYISEHHLPKVQYNIETKSTPEGDDRLHPKPDVFMNMLYDLLKEKGVLQHCIIQSFDVRTLQVLKKRDARVTTALLIGNAKSFEKNLDLLGFAPDIYSPIYLLVNKKLIKKCHAKNIRIIPWTVDDEKKMIKFKAMGVDGVITDYPDVAVRVLR